MSQSTAPRSTTSNITENIDEDADDSATDTDDRSIAPGGTGHHKRAKSNPKESTRGRNRSDLPQQYHMPPDTRFDERFLPEVQFLYGLEPNPWSHLSVTLVQRARDKVFTEFQDTLTTKSAVFRNVRTIPLFLVFLTNLELQAKASLYTWRRALLKKAEKVVADYFMDKDRFTTTSDIARQAQFLLGDRNLIPWLFENGPNVTEVKDVVRSLLMHLTCR